jgi:tetratricopeptide (TPR) repeat protein
MIGETLNERYKIKSELGQGGMGTVYRAHDDTLNRDVAVKLMSNTKLGTEGRARLMAEAQTIAQLNHPNIVTVFDVGQFESLPYIVMELVEGKTLRDDMPQEWEDMIAVAKQVTAALQHAHDHDIIHRDLKPENVVIEPDGIVKLMDFGIAHSVSSRITSDGMIIGTVYYMSPEQAMGKSVDARADLYSLGIMLYEFATGDVPFEDFDPIAVISQHINAPIVPPRAKRADIPPGLDALIMRLLEKEPDDRPSSAEEVLKELNDPLFLDTGAYPVQELSLLDRIVRGRMVGRKAEFEEARALWMKAVSGQGQLLLISGEPGIGKTRLTRETATHAEVSGGRALTGACYAEGGAPYSAFGQIIRQVFANGEKPAIDLPEYVMADLLTLAPDMQPHFPDVPPNPKLESQFEQQRIFENISTFFCLLSAEVPLLLVVEDVHWAESGTLLLLLHLARNVHKNPILLVANYREVELDKGHPFHQILLDLNREHLTSRIKLARLDRDQTSDLLSSMFDDETSPDFLEGIYHETEGNPFFIEEVCKALVETGKLYFEDGDWHRPSMDELEVPQSIRIAIQARVEKLAEEYQGILNLAAVLGHEFDFEVLSAASSLDEDTLIDALEAAEKAQLVRDNPQGGPNAFAFVHALIPSTIYESINSLRRGRLHRRAAEAIQTLHSNDYEQLAYHYTGAGDLENAIENYQLAAQRAQEVFALDAAIRDLQAALDLIEPGEHIQMKIETLANLAHVHHKLGDNIRSISVYQEALNLWEGDGSKDELAAARIYHNIMDVSNFSTFDDFQQFEDTYQTTVNASLKLVETLPRSPATVYLLMSLSEHFWAQVRPPDHKEIEHYSRAASAMAKKLDNPVLQSATLGAQYFVYFSQAKHRQWLEICRQRLEISQHPAFDDPHEMTDILHRISRALVTVGEYEQALDFIGQTLEHTEKTRDVFTQVMALTSETHVWFQMDRWDEVVNVYEKWRALKQRYPNFIKQAGPLCLQIGITASVFTLRGDKDKGVALREESFEIMTAWSGPEENWGRGNYY